MTADPDRARRRGVRGIMLCSLLLVWCPRAFALNPALDVSQYGHTSWKIREGFTRSTINSIAQTPDGYLWLATESGLLRFDGVRTVPWQPSPNQHLPSNNITRLLVTRDGTLWIGTRGNGLASWKNGNLTVYPELAKFGIAALLEDREGSVWVGGWAIPAGTLCAIHDGIIQCYGADGRFNHGVFGLYEDSKRTVWVAASYGLWRWKPGAPQFYPMPDEPDGIQAFSEDDDGTLLIGTRSGIRRFIDGKIAAYGVAGTLTTSPVVRMLRDREGSLWLGTSAQGLVHVHRGKADVFAPRDGLLGGHVGVVFEDREGTIWVSTSSGLDRFRDLAVATLTGNQGLSNAPIVAVLADRHGGVWIGTFDGLKKWNDGEITAYRARAHAGSPAPQAAREIVATGAPNSVESLLQDHLGRIWVATPGGVSYLQNDRFVSIRGFPGGIVHSMVEDDDGFVWIGNQDSGLSRVSPDGEVQRIPWSTLGRADYALGILADPRNGGLWAGFQQGGVAYFAGGQVRASYSTSDGLGAGRVLNFRLDHDGVLWVVTEGGLSRLKNGRVTTLNSQSGLPCDAVHWNIEDDSHSLWMSMACGLVRIDRGELDAWTTAADVATDRQRPVHFTLFDSSDGVRTSSTPSFYSPLVAKSPDGKLWFVSEDGLNVLDPRHLPFNTLPPPVHIEQITADRKTYAAEAIATGHTSLPALTRDIQIDYTALSLVAPEKMRFRYKLEGWDRDWEEVGTRRQAFYTNLPPRTYRFRATASNNSGVWNEAGAFVDFRVAPAYYQTMGFRVLVAAFVIASLAAFYQLRLRQAARRFNMTLEARVSERTRIARDLHDTLLQSFHGVLLQFRAATNLLPDHSDARKTFESAIDQAAQAITEGRDAVQGLRASTVVTNDLAPALRTLGDELAGDQRSPNGTSFTVEVEGTPRDLHPIMRDEIYRVAGEALRNAFRHAQATRIEVEIRYDNRYLRVRVRDDGKGIDAQLLDGGGRAGHYGLAGMYERAALIGGKLTVWSELESGTEVELTIPASVAYAKSARVARSLASGAET